MIPIEILEKAGRSLMMISKEKILYICRDSLNYFGRFFAICYNINIKQ